jgi:CII-binding regulator of phage lambda lysogenization HflD
MEMRQILEMLERMEAKLDASHEKMMATLDAHHERIMSPLGKTEAMDFKANPEEMESITEQ